AWCFGISMLAAWLGLSREMGALIAGIAISTFPYNLDVIAKVISLRDFFITLFFVTLGAKIPQPTWDVVWISLAGSLFVILSRFFSITPILAALGNGNRTSIIPAINLSQVSEFSLVIGALGVSFGHIDARVLTVIVFMMVLTSVVSTYGIQYNFEIFRGLNPWLKRLGMRDLDSTPSESPGEGPKGVVFLGFTHYASSLLHDLQSANPALTSEIAIVDFNPLVKKELDRRGIQAIYGDISHPDTLHHARIHHGKVLVSTVPDYVLKGTSNARLLRHLAAAAPKAQIIVTAENFKQARELYQQGAAFVFLPRLMSMRELCGVVLAALGGSLDQHRQAAFAELEARDEVLP
ncbi:MAG: cation:proton antiporter, partial [Terriglobales bacterium]